MSGKNVIKLSVWTQKVKNSVEDDLKEELKEIIREYPNWGWEQLSFQDVYGYAINQLPPIYIVKGSAASIRLSREEIRNAIFVAMNKVDENPIHRPKKEDSEKFKIEQIW